MSDEMYTVELASGGIQRVPYRRAVSLVSRGLAVWTTVDTAEESEAPVVDDTPDEPETPEQEPEADLPDPVEQPKTKDRPRLKKTTKLSTPAQKGQEGAEAENKPPKQE